MWRKTRSAVGDTWKNEGVSVQGSSELEVSRGVRKKTEPGKGVLEGSVGHRGSGIPRGFLLRRGLNKRHQQFRMGEKSRGKPGMGEISPIASSVFDTVNQDLQGGDRFGVLPTPGGGGGGGNPNLGGVNQTRWGG